MNAPQKHVSSTFYKGKAETVKWISIKLMLKYSDLLVEVCRMVNIAP